MNNDNKANERFKELLKNKKSEVEKTIKSMKENNTGEEGNYLPTELSFYDNHPADAASELFQTEFHKGLKVHEENLLADVNDAIRRVDEGSYGKCARCGGCIAEERLEALPYAKLCIECANTLSAEKDAINHEVIKSRPIERAVLDAPLGRKYLNKREDDEAEGLDYFNDLMKYGSSDTPQDMGGYHDYLEFYTNDVDKQGIVDNMDQVSNEEYLKQLPD